MAKRTRFAEYKDRYKNYRFELSQEGILLMQCHTNGASLVWDWEAHDGMADAFADIAGDREIKVLIHTTRMLFTQDLKRAFLDELGHGLARETYAQRQFFPFGGGMRALDRPWDQRPWSD